LRVAGIEEFLQQQQSTEGDRVLLSIAQEIRGGLREFDVLARTAVDSFEILIPEPDCEIAALLGPLARRAREAIRREPDESLESRLKLEFGYALLPEETQTLRGLYERAQTARIVSD
jgi:GGDEF domain-containing protein